ncbi:MAG: MBL fold metallo-hydrolase [Acidobacteria bacterium]|nr:MBL fold metallo-hydrolase [Acidobacteriota bacterium]
MPSPISLTFLGAAGTVTGSKHLLDFDGHRVLADCGLFQGLKELRLRNWEGLPVDPSSIEAVILTHAHLDHCGYLPRLVTGGFRGRIFCTPGTKELCSLILPAGPRSPAAGRLQPPDPSVGTDRGRTGVGPRSDPDRGVRQRGSPARVGVRAGSAWRQDDSLRRRSRPLQPPRPS